MSKLSKKIDSSKQQTPLSGLWQSFAVILPSPASCPRTLQREARNCTKLIIWTDCDREGENIGMEIVSVCQEVKPSILVSRARFSEITPHAIHQAINTLTVMDENMSLAVDTRQELDLRIGAAFTRFQTLRLRRAFPRALAEQLISYGSCQFPTLGFVVERFREVENFVPEPFWKIVAHFDRQNTQTSFTWKRGRLFDRDCCSAYHQHLLEEMEKLAARKLRIGAKQTMQLAESLYTRGFISYPRTETNMFPAELDLVPLVQAQTEDSRWSAFAHNLLTNGLRPRAGKKSDKAHPPIHPLKCGSALQGVDARLFELIVRHFLACLSDDAKGAETTVTICIGTSELPTRRLISEDGELFEAKGLVIHARNYLNVYIYEKWSERDMPEFILGENVTPREIQMIESQTTAPNLLTEADLIGLMDRHGIGTDATHAEHIETIKQRLYVGLQDNKFLVPGQLGMGLVEGGICEGRKTREDVLRSQTAKYKAVFETAVMEARKLDVALANRLSQEAENVADPVPGLRTVEGYSKVFQCPSCSKDVIIRQKKAVPASTGEQGTALLSINGSGSTTWFLSCTGFPACRFAVWLPDCVIGVRVVRQQEMHSPSEKLTPSPCVPCHPSCITQQQQHQQQQQQSSLPNGATLLGFKFRLGTRLPSGYIQDAPDRDSEDIALFPNRYATCIFCDTDFRTAFNIRISFTTPPSTGTVSSDSQAPPRPPPLSRPPGTATRPRPSLAIKPAQSNSALSARQPPAALVSGWPARSLHTQGGPTSFSDADSTTASASIVCNCGLPARLLTVRKPGANQGLFSNRSHCCREFFKCGDSSDVCNFFMWKDSDSAGSMSATPSYEYAPSQTGQTSGLGQSLSFTPLSRRSSAATAARSNTEDSGQVLDSHQDGQPTCSCGLPALLMPGDASSGCRFFQWADGGVTAPTMAGQAFPLSSAANGLPFPSRRRGRGGGGGGGRAPSGAGDGGELPSPLCVILVGFQ
ncbi:unnamed protein product [Schistocephalus solidus]|uniref:DNA topoisomerase n=1 Tax=Schistocephalus solidus TaxID=70667 RepID=A0A183SQD6_SCHSO|nr:unnamed protein product [Schistocephalus solidus]